MGLDAGHLLTQHFQALACGQLLLAVCCLLDVRQLPTQAVQPLAVIGERQRLPTDEQQPGGGGQAQ
ncbi:hypothetical protein D9M71_710320 [compost metagenome]